jgi:KDO2-lipid IV(A) lauroyltransferase
MAAGKRAQMIFGIMDRTLTGLFDFARFAVRLLPPRVLVAVAYGIGYAMYYMRRGSRKWLLNTLREALPDVSDEREIVDIAKKVFSAPLRAMLDLMFLERYGTEIDDRVKATTDVEEAISRVHEREAEGKGLIFFSPHLGGISIIHAIAARFGVAYTPLVRHPDLTPIPCYVWKLVFIAQSVGCDPENPVFFTGSGMDAVPKAQEHLRKRKRLGITYDMVGGTVADFFGHPTAIASGIARLALDSGAPIMPAYLARQKDPLTFRLYLYDPIKYELSGDQTEDIKAILEAVIRKGEEMIREAPEEWIGWFGLRQWRARAEQITMKEALS